MTIEIKSLPVLATLTTAELTALLASTRTIKFVSILECQAASAAVSARSVKF